MSKPFAAAFYAYNESNELDDEKTNDLKIELDTLGKTRAVKTVAGTVLAQVESVFSGFAGGIKGWFSSNT